MEEEIGEMISEGIESPKHMIDSKGKGDQGTVIGRKSRFPTLKRVSKDVEKPGAGVNPWISEDEKMLIPQKGGLQAIPVENGAD